ncbi:MAG: TonB family protein [Nitrospirae bacterium]|nr:MAG: TonB family protein [Nitrospirota bacterium]
MRIRIFLVVSVIIHALIFTGIYLLPPAKEKKKQEFSTKLVSPEELRKKEERPPVPVRRIPVIPVPRVRPRPLPVPPQQQALKQPQTRPSLPPRIPAEGAPVVPGEGSGGSRPLPEGSRPGKDSGAPPGEGGDIKPGIEQARPGATLRRRLLDSGVTDAVARKDTAAQRKQDEGITFDTKEYRFAGYMSKLKGKIESIWVYPPEAIAKGIYGDLRLRFTIKKDGKLERIELVRTSGYRMLDEAAIRALKDGEPYWPLPDEWGMETYTITGHFIYGLHGYQLR